MRVQLLDKQHIFNQIQTIDNNLYSATPKEDDSKIVLIGRKSLWLMATLRNAFVLFITSIILFCTQINCPFSDDIEAVTAALNTTDYSCVTPTTVSKITLPPFKFPDVNITTTDGTPVGIVVCDSAFSSHNDTHTEYCLNISKIFYTTANRVWGSSRYTWKRTYNRSICCNLTINWNRQVPCRKRKL